MMILTVSSIPFHAILRSNLTKIGFVDCKVLRILCQSAFISTLAPEVLPIFFE